jgi:lysophospholipase L1-like esterase
MRRVLRIGSVLGALGGLALAPLIGLSGHAASAAGQGVAPAAVAAAPVPVRVMPLGDSITYGYPANGGCTASAPLSYQGSYRIELAKKFPAGTLTYVGSASNGPAGMLGGNRHEGHCGAWLADHASNDLASRVTTWVTNARPDVVLLQGGTNDIIFGAQAGNQPDAATLARRLRLVIDRVHAAAPRATIGVASPTKMDRSTAYYNAVIPAVVQQARAAGVDAVFVDVYSSGLVFPADYRSGDPVHPDTSGYAKVANTWNAGMRAVILARYDALNGGSTPTSATVVPTADTCINNGTPSTNRGSSASLCARGNGAASFLRFNLPVGPAGKRLVGATLRVHTTYDPSAGSPDTQQIRLGTDSWSESTLTWNTRPSLAGAVLGTFRAGSFDTPATSVLDVAALGPRLGTTTSLVVTAPTGTNDLWFFSRDYGDTSKRPRLTLTFG